MTTPLRLDPTRVLELTFVTVHPSKITRLLCDYFPAVLPVAAEYGGRAVASFQLVAAGPEAVRCAVVGMFEWPSVDAFYRAREDPRVVALLPTRDEALEFLREGLFYRPLAPARSPKYPIDLIG